MCMCQLITSFQCIYTAYMNLLNLKRVKPGHLLLVSSMFCKRVSKDINMLLKEYPLKAKKCTK